MVSPKETIVIEKLTGQAGDEIIFDNVLLIANDDKVSLGKPFVKGSKVIGKVVDQGKGEKLVVFKYRAKSRYRRKIGHRQQQTTVEIVSIA